MSKVKENKLSIASLMISFICMDAVAISSDMYYPLNEAMLESSFLTINFNHSPPEGYGSQDKIGHVSTSVDGASLKMSANRWQYIPIDYDITTNTILEFDVLMNSVSDINFQTL